MGEKGFEIMEKQVSASLRTYVEQEILPRYDHFDKAHQGDHVRMVISQSLRLAERLDVDIDMAYAIAAYHDTGLCEGRDCHHHASARIILNDKALRRWFSEEQIQVMADAAEDHRASSDHEPRSIYGRIVAEADRQIDPMTVIRRTVQYGLDHYPDYGREEHFQRTKQHLHEKYGRNGYLKLWFADSDNARQLEKLQCIMDDENQLRQLFEKFYSTKNN